MQLVAMRILTYVTCVLVTILGHCIVHCACMCDVSDCEVNVLLLASYHSVALLLAVNWSPIMAT